MHIFLNLILTLRLNADAVLVIEQVIVHQSLYYQAHYWQGKRHISVKIFYLSQFG